MIELAKHIEILLLENDCVIVPGMGGFIAHYRTAKHDEDSDEFCPPARVIGFNARLTMNDGLLVQSYMQAYNTDFPDATRKIEKVVTQIKEQLYTTGQVELNRIGVLYYNMNGTYSFEPYSESLLTPSLYGLERFTFPALMQTQAESIRETEQAVVPAQTPLSLPERKTVFRMPYRHIWQNVAAVAAVILLFFLLSTPVENTYVDSENYASLGSPGLFDAIRNHSVVTRVSENKAKPAASQARRAKAVAASVPTAEHPAVRTETVPAAKTEQPAAKATGDARGYYIIIASLPDAAKAEREIGKFKAAGYESVQLLKSDGRFRIALAHYSKQSDAYRKVQEVRTDARLKDAWVFYKK